MKYLLIIGFFLLSSAFATTGVDSSSTTENCAHSPQDTNTGSEWNKLLAQLTAEDNKEEEERISPKSTKGQR